MDSRKPVRRLIVNADDFGRSRSINQAVIRAHQEGILTTASLMVNEDAAAEAVELARQNPKLGVGLHLSLVCGRSALPPEFIPTLVNQKGEFTDNPVKAGCRYFFNRRCRQQLEAEIMAQFERFASFGLPMDHINGHLHMHLHPAVFKIITDGAARWNIKAIRLTRDPFMINARLASGRWLYRASHALIYRILSARARPAINRLGIRYTSNVFGLLQNTLVDSDFVMKLLPELPEGDSELYSHPSLDQFKNEFDALMNPAARLLVKKLGIELIRYQDL